MYEVLSFSNSEMTRYVKLKNCVTEKVELCFDNSDLHHEGQQDFWFMKVGENTTVSYFCSGLHLIMMRKFWNRNAWRWNTSALCIHILGSVDL